MIILDKDWAIDYVILYKGKKLQRIVHKSCADDKDKDETPGVVFHDGFQRCSDCEKNVPQEIWEKYSFLMEWRNK